MITQIVLTGGPCSGKSSSLTRLVEAFSEKSIRCLVVPEAATMIMSGGVGDFFHFAEHQRSEYLRVQNHLIALQDDLRARFVSMAEGFREDCVIIFDRGQMDAAAYTTPEEFQDAMTELGGSLNKWRDSYDAVLHLKTAADGAEEFYTLANNSARQEGDLESARAADQRTLDAWMGHPHLRVIGNEGDFEDKLRRVIQEVEHVLGIPEPLEIEYKYVVKNLDLEDKLLERAVKVDIEQTYLQTNNGEKRVRARSQNGDHTYFLTEKFEQSKGVRVEREHIIDEAEFKTLLLQKDEARKPVKKHRYCFVYADQYLELDVFQDQLEGLVLMEVEVSSEDQQVKLPDWQMENVTDDKNFSNANLAKLGNWS